MNLQKFLEHKYLIINCITLFLGSISYAFGYGFKFDVVLYTISSTVLLRYVLIPSIGDFSKSFFKGIKEGLNEIATSNVSGINLRTVAINFGNHYAGITACFYSAMHNPSTTVVVAELVKIGSFLGIEIPIVNVITSKAAQLASNTLREETLEDCIPLIGTAAALTGQEISGISLDSFVQKQARNITNIKVIQDQVRAVLETSGIITPKNHEKLLEISTLLLLIREDFEYFTKLMAIAGHELNKPEGRKRLNLFESRVKELNALIKSVNQPSLKNNAVFTEASNLISLALKILVQAKIVQSQKMRPTPVGVCLHGVSGIGKSTLTTALINAVKDKITKKYSEELGPADDWQTWFAQFRDDFDTGYNGQEITYMDDAFQKKDCTDHPMWINFISNQPIGMVMAREEEKGKPFNSLMCMVTCNVLPNKSTTISDISALHNRFPITIAVSLKEGKRLPASNAIYDSKFEHMKFKVGRMSQFVNGSRQTKETSFDEIVELIALSIFNNNKKCNLILQSGLTQQQTDSDDENEVEGVIYFDPKKVAGYEESQDSDSENGENLSVIDEEDEDSEDYTEVEQEYRSQDSENYEQLRQIKDVRANTKWEVDRRIGESILNAFTQDPIINIRGLGPWIWKLKRRSDGERLQDVYHEYREMPAADFLRAIAIWDIQYEGQQYQHIPVLKVQDSWGTDYIWGPSLMQGQYLFGACEGFRLEVIERMKPYYIRKFNKVKSNLYSMWNNPRTSRALIRYAVATTGLIFLPLPSVTGYFQRQAMYSAFPEFAAMVEDASNQAWYIRYNPWLRADYWMRRKVENAYVILEETLKIIKDTTVTIIIKVCELLGIDTTGLIQNFANMMGDVALHATILSIFSILLYLMYKLILSFTVKDELHQYEGVYNKERYSRKVKKEKRKINRMRHETEFLLCKDCATQSTIDIMGETFDYHHDKHNNDLYQAHFIDIIEEYVDEDHTYVGSIYQNKDQCSLINIYSSEEILKIKENRIVWYGQKEHPLLDNKKSVCIHIQCVSTDIRQEISNTLKGYKILGIVEFMIDFAITYIDNVVSCDLIIFGLRAVKEGQLNHITKNNIAQCSKYANNFNLEKVDVDPSTIANIIHTEAMQNAVALGNSIKEHHQVQLATCALELIDTENFSNRSFGFGHKNYIITNAHAVKDGELVRFHKTRTPTTSLHQYNLAIVISRDPVRDIAILRILKREESLAIAARPLYRMSNKEIVFSDLSKHLYNDESWNEVVDNTAVIVDLPKSGITVPSIARCRENKRRKFPNEEGDRDYIVITSFTVGTTYSKPGDCGGYIIATNDRYDTKMIGFHAASGEGTWFGSLLTKEDLRGLQSETACDDSWKRLILPGKPTDLPNGDEVEFLGKYKGMTRPVSSDSIDHWHHSPWFEQFEEQLQPSPLSAKDPRITAVIPKNSVGKPSLLIAQNSNMCKSLPNMEQYILDIIEKSMIDELSCKLEGNLKTTVMDEDRLLHNAINGLRDNEFVTNLTLNKAAGIPWASIPKGMLKSDYLEHQDNKVIFNKGLGQVLRKRVLLKINEANKGKRIISFSNSKIKDSLIKKKAVAIGKVRVFHSIPVDKIIADSALFGNFKESFQQLFLDANHAIGVNPHSKGWGLIHDKISKHPNYFDCDFENYDKYLHKELMHTVFNIIIKTIDKVAPDNWSEARKILALESIETFVVDYDTIYKTERGNKSGEFLTTVVNCIANDILSFYSWIKTTGIDSIETFRDNVSIVTYGDDKIESVSDEYAKQYNYMTVKEVLTEIGHKITPGSKDGIEQPFTSIDNLMFIKRTFSEQNGEIVAPLLQRSIESPFTWTEISFCDIGLWEGIIKEKLYEAYIWGEEYYEEFRKKLMKCNSKPLRVAIAPIIAVPYAQNDYWNKCYKYE